MSLQTVAAVISGVIVGSALSQAQTTDTTWKIKGKVRGDAVQSTTETKEGTAEKETKKSSSVVLKRAQVEFIGTKGPVDLHLKYYFDGNYLKNAYVEYNLSPSCSLSFGKVDARDFSMEWDYSTTDNYIFSTIADTSKPYHIDNVPGVEAKGVFGDHAVYLQVLQGATLDDTDTVKTHSTGGLTTTLQYRGSFADKMVRPIASYAMVRTASSKIIMEDGTAHNYGNGYQTHMGLGVKLAIAGTTTDLEYDTVKVIKEKDLETSKDENLNSIILQTRLMSFADVTPYIKVIMDTHKKGKDNNIDDMTRTAYALGAEYAWNPNIRVHGIYSMDNKSTKKTTDTSTKVNKSAINLGLTASI